MNAPDGELANAEDPQSDHASATGELARMSLPALPAHEGQLLPAVAPSSEITVAPGTTVRVVMESPAPTTYVVPRTMQWSLRQLLEVLIVMAVIAAGGLTAGAAFGRRVEPVYAARSEFIYYLEDSIPDGFLREDRRILTQLVTIESEAVVAPVAAEFDTTADDIRSAMSVDVLDLSEVIRLDIQDPDGARALAMNAAVLERYQQIAQDTDRRDDRSELVERRDAVLDELAVADQAALDIAAAELSDIALLSQEESLQRQVESTNARVDRLTELGDNSLSTPVVTNDRASLQAQLTASRSSLVSLEGQLLAVRTERAQVQSAIELNAGSGVPESASGYRQRDAVLSVREDSLELEIDTVSDRIRNLEGLIAETLVNQAGIVDTASIGTELSQALAARTSLETELVDVRTQRAALAQSAAQLPSLTRRIERLEVDLTDLDTQVAAATTTAASPSPIEILTEPLLLADPVGNPVIQWAALGFIASLPVAAVGGAFVRQRQRKQR